MAERALLATYRVQLTADFGFDQARSLVPYLHALGISHLYCSPITRARPGSTHGYDVADPRELNPELGGEQGFRALVAELHVHGMGMLVDIVPNHMSTGAANPYWMDVLERGQASRYAAWFDIDWSPPEKRLRGRVLVPVLGARLRDVVTRGELTLAYEGGRFLLRYFEHRFPVDPATLPSSLRLDAADADDGDERSRARGDALAEMNRGAGAPERLLALLRRQAYRLAPWQKARRINYRRFFDINELIGVRVEDPQVMAETHELILSLVGDGSVDGLRVDHIDGLLDPLAYLHRLRAASGSASSGRSVPLVVEKILSPGERLREEWPVDGTTGYEFLNQLESLFVSARGRDRIEKRYRTLTRGRDSFQEVARHGKLLLLGGALAPDVRRLTRLLIPIVRRDPSGAGSGISRARLHRAIVQLIAVLPVYRSYVEGGAELHAEDRRVVEEALRRARALRDADEAALTVVAGVLLGPPDAAALRFAQRFQQVSGPATAKGVEDTALYRYVPLLSLNEVGGAPDRPLADAAAVLHAANAERSARWQRTLLATDTHDTKRSADARSRIDVLSEIPDAWAREVAVWRRLNRAYRRRVSGRAIPDASTEWLLYQTLVALWPIGEPGRELAALRDRVQEYLLKAMREAKRRTSWTEPNDSFEHGVSEFVDAILDPDRSRPFLDALGSFVARIALAGFWNALSAVLIHATAPGVPDIYQGSELWSFCLVDPDNRRPVDFEQRRVLLEGLPSVDRPVAADWCRDALARPEDGRLKLLVLARSLRARHAHPLLFTGGEYLPLAASGEQEDHLFVFGRAHRRESAIVVAPRLILRLTQGRRAPIGDAVWGDSVIALPASLAGRRWRSALTGQEVDASDGRPVRAADVLADLPVGLLLAVDESIGGRSVASSAHAE